MNPKPNNHSALSTLALGISLLPMALQCREPAPDPGGQDWPVYGGDQGASRYSPLEQIDTSNVVQLEPVWVHHTEDASQFFPVRTPNYVENTINILANLLIFNIITHL